MFPKFTRCDYCTVRLPRGANGKEATCQCRTCKRHGFNPWVRKTLLEEGMATQSNILAWRIPMDRGAWWPTVHRVTESDMTEAT